MQAWAAGDENARDQLVPIIYGTLHRLAQHYLYDERNALTLQPTALVHEAYMRLVEQDAPDWNSRGHFFGVAAHLMRQVLVDHARQRMTAKRGGGAVKLDLDDVALPALIPQSADILALNEALNELGAADDRKCKVIELRYFGGFTEEETAQSLSTSVATVRRDLRAAEAWLSARLNPGM